MSTGLRYFTQHASKIPGHGLGLSVDVYSPDLFELIEALESEGLEYGYLEVFKAPCSVLGKIRKRLPTTLPIGLSGGSS